MTRVWVGGRLKTRFFLPGGDTNLYVYVYNNLVDPVGLWGLAFGGTFGSALTYLGGGWGASGGIFFGSEGVGVYGSAHATQGLGGYIGAGREYGYYQNLNDLEGLSVGAKAEVGLRRGGGANASVTPGGRFSHATISAGPEFGAYVGGTVGYTKVFNVSDWIKRKALEWYEGQQYSGPVECEEAH